MNKVLNDIDRQKSGAFNGSLEHKKYNVRKEMTLISQQNEVIQALKNEVEQTFGRRVISSRDCIQLSDDIALKVSYRISSNTLRRFFGLIKAEYPASSSTITMLSKYCGFDSPDELLENRRKDANKPVPNGSGILNYIVSLFKSTEVKSTSDETYLSLVKQTISFIQKNEPLIDKFQKAIAKTKNGQQFYFETFVNVDKLNDYYGEGLRYYLKEKSDTNSQLFGLTLLAIRSWLTTDKEHFFRYFNEVKLKKIQQPAPAILYARYFGVFILDADINNTNADQFINDAREVHNQFLKRREHFKNFPLFEYAMAMVLLCTGHYKEALYYAEYGLKNFKEMHDVDKSLCRSIELIKSFALVKMGRRKEGEKIFNALRPSSFYFLSRKTATIIYLVLSKHLNKTTSKTETQLNLLIEETGFNRLLLI